MSTDIATIPDLDALADGPFRQILQSANEELLMAALLVGKTQPEDIMDPTRHPSYVCPHCGYTAATNYPDVGLFVYRSLTTHYYSHPDCWAKNQAICQQNYASERERNPDGGTWPWWHYRQHICRTCRRPIFCHVQDKPALRCAFCVGDTIRLNKRKKPQPKTCEICGETFTPKRHDAKTCTTACRQMAYRHRVTENRQPTVVSDD